MILDFMFYLVFYLLTVIIVTVAMSQYHAASGIAGVLSGIFIVGGFIGCLWIVNNITRFGIKKIMVFSTIFYLLLTLLYFVTPNIELLLIIRFLHGLGFGVAATASGTLAGLIAPLSRRGEAIGYYALSVTLASAVAHFYQSFCITHLILMFY